jgi:hypothetical protein
VQHNVSALDRARRLRTAIFPAPLQQVPIEVVDVGRCQLGDREVPETGDEMSVDEALGRRRPAR